MATIEITVRDDEGNIVSRKEEFLYKVELGGGRFDELEGAVDEFKKRASRELSLFFLGEEQQKFIREKKSFP